MDPNPRPRRRSLCVPPVHAEHLRQLPLGQTGLIEHLANRLAEPSARD
jgi:hypothetical protein